MNNLCTECPDTENSRLAVIEVRAGTQSPSVFGGEVEAEIRHLCEECATLDKETATHLEVLRALAV